MWARFRSRNAERGRAVRQFFATMPAASKFWLSAAVFCCFAPLGLLRDMANLGQESWLRIAAWTLFSGSTAVAYAWTALILRRWLAVVMVAHLAATFLLARLLPDVPAPVALDAAATAAVRARLSVIGLASATTMMLAYLTFVVLLQREGRRFGRVQAEIQLAREIHATLVPAVAGVHGDLEWRGVSLPSGEVGGDLVEVFHEGDGKWLACVADVSGHGVAAGLLMAMFKTALHAHAADSRDVGDLAGRIHATIHPLKQPNMFITCALLRQPAPGTLELLLAGHPQMLHVRAGTGTATWIGESQVAIGLLERAAYTSQVADFAPGDLLVVVTDGLIEIFDRQDREFGPDGLAGVVSRMAGDGRLEDLEREIFEACRRHGAQLDDQTLLVVRTRR